MTLNRSDAIDPSRVILRTTYHHPVFTPASVAAQARHRELNGVHGHVLLRRLVAQRLP